MSTCSRKATQGCGTFSEAREPVTIRFLDPPLHEFVPIEEANIRRLADVKHKSVDEIKTLINSLHEFNPMMGHRGVRLDVTYPEISKIQTPAVIRAAIAVQKRHPDWTVKPEIMIPLVGDNKEFLYVKKIVGGRDDDRDPARGADRGRDCEGRGLLLLRDERSDADDLRLLAR